MIRSVSRQFQFHKGTIRTENKIIKTKSRSIYFNSIKVRLELVPQRYAYPSKVHFNSIKVRLELAELGETLVTCRNFNSIKVRLEQSAGLNPYLMMKFQFHKGTIRTNKDNRQLRAIQISIP